MTPHRNDETQPVSVDPGNGAPTRGVTRDVGADLWDFLASFVAARSTFLSIYRLYEQRVLGAARIHGVTRENLVLPPAQLFDLFHLRRLELFRDARLAALRDLAHRAFGEAGEEDLLDVYCTHIFHEFTILTEEHRSVGRFVRIHDPRRYRQLFEEVSGYYPMRLRRIRRLFSGGLRRLEALLPEWHVHRVVVRSMYLFGDRLARKVYRSGLDSLYERMYPEGGAVRGYLEAARSFYDSGFLGRAREAAMEALGAADQTERRRLLDVPERHSRNEAWALLSEVEARLSEVQ